MRKSHRKPRPRSPEEWERCNVKHARKRLGERCGLYISEQEYWEIVSRIQLAFVPDNYAKLVCSDGPNKNLYEVKVQGRWVVAIWSKPLVRVMTFLPREEALMLRGLLTESLP